MQIIVGLHNHLMKAIARQAQATVGLLEIHNTLSGLMHITCYPGQAQLVIVIYQRMTLVIK